MTAGDQRRISTLGLAKALHPAGWSRLPEPQPDERTGDSAPVAASAGAVQTVLWQEDSCRAGLGAARQGWLSLAGREARLPVVIAAVDGDDVLLVARPTWGLGDAEVVARLEVGGVTPELRRWVVRVDGLLQSVVADASPPATEGLAALPDPEVGDLDPEQFTVLALTVRSVRGFESGTRPDGS